MKIITGLEVVKENLLKSKMGIGYVQDGIDYITYLEEQNKRFKEQLTWAFETCIYLNNSLQHPSASDDFVFQRELKKLEETK